MLPFWQSQGGQANWRYTNNRPVGLYGNLIEAKTDPFTPARLETYVAEPENGSTAKSIIFLVDSTLMPVSFFLSPQHTELTPLVLGWTFPNVHLLADNYAKAGFYAYVPDIHKSDSLPIEFFAGRRATPARPRVPLGRLEDRRNRESRRDARPVAHQAPRTCQRTAH